ncbi:MAG: hypothetical protein ABI191_04805 [Rhizomicrobium sp.]
MNKADRLDISWQNVIQIDATRVPTPVVENFFIKLHFEDGSTFEVSDTDTRFQKFRADLIENWPELETPLNSIYAGSPNIEEHATLWKRRISY